jgi:hypothetical protein
MYKINKFSYGFWLYGLKSTNFVHSETYLQHKNIHGLKPKICEHTGIKKPFKPKFKEWSMLWPLPDV